jgi:chemosensory pili system protein ChpA (sensor histidine kinase/response regulator)
MQPDPIDRDLLPVFLEEARALLRLIGDGLMQLSSHPHPVAVLANLRGSIHTIKGSARMAGAMQFGAHWHAFEEVMSPLLQHAELETSHVTDLLGRYDQALVMLGQLYHGHQQWMEEGKPNLGTDISHTASVSHAVGTPSVKAFSYVRIRSQLLDSLWQQASALDMAAAHVQSGIKQLGVLHQVYTEKMQRLHQQLRDAEMQADLHMRAEPTPTKELRNFDALELDQFTLLHQFIRTMRDGMSDLVGLHKHFAQQLEQLDDVAANHVVNIHQMQDAVMAARLVRFSSVRDRLQSVLRQAARETKRDIRLRMFGEHLEIDRSVLDKMTIVLEHLLRNAAAHGIEHRLHRLDIGKPAEGQVTIALSIIANALCWRVMDDGAGMDLSEIALRAQSVGALQPDVALTSHNLFDVLAHPGFSTAQHITSLAGRGVGLDVVRQEVVHLGGRIELASELGHGSTFTMYIPLTFATHQVMIVRAGQATYAIPATVVMAVIACSDPDAGFKEGESYQWETHTLVMASLAQRLQTDTAMLGCRMGLVLQHGQTMHFIGVDAVLGKESVVMQAMTQQGVRVPGILAAARRANGEIVLLVQPTLLGRPSVPLASVPPVKSATTVTVLVVDDSVTVRRSLQTLLSRAGYVVRLAIDGVDALSQIAQARPDIVLLDIEMPNKDGFGVLENLRQSPATAQLPVVIMTSRTASKHQQKASALGADAFIGKPYLEAPLLRLIRRLTASSRRTD